MTPVPNDVDRQTPPSPIRAVGKGGGARRAVTSWVHWPHWPKFFQFAAPLVTAAAAFLASHANQSADKRDTEKKVAVAYQTLAPATNDRLKENEELKAAVAQLADTVQLQGKLLLAMQPGFTPAGKPEPAKETKKRKGKKPTADPKLVQQVQKQAVQNLEELKERVKEAAPAATPVPVTLPPEAPKPAAAQPSAPSASAKP